MDQQLRKNFDMDDEEFEEYWQEVLKARRARQEAQRLRELKPEVRHGR